jgi:F-type H+-transporting ATPase subunit delta
MISLAVASRYAGALVDVVLDPKSAVRPEQALAELRSFEDTLGSSLELRHALASPAVSVARKRRIIERLGERAGLGRISRNFLFVLNHHRRMDALSGILDRFEVMLDERLGFSRAEVTSAHELNPQQRAQLQQELARMTGGNVKLRFAVNASLIGGVVARIGSTVYDGSVRGQLIALGRRLSAE